MLSHRATARRSNDLHMPAYQVKPRKPCACECHAEFQQLVPKCPDCAGTGFQQHPSYVFYPPIINLDQESEGICEGESLAGAATTCGVRISPVTPGGGTPISGLCVVAMAHTYDGVYNDGGTSFELCVQGLREKGVVAYSPTECDEPGASLLMDSPPTAEYLAEAAQNRFDVRYTLIDPHAIDAWDQVKDALASGHLCQFECGVTPEFEVLGIDAVCMPSAVSGPDDMGHSMLIRGYDSQANELIDYSSWKGFAGYTDRAGTVHDGCFAMARECMPNLWAIRVIDQFVRVP